MSAEVDIVTGEPKSVPKEKEDRIAQKYDRLMTMKGKADRLSDDINSEKGQAVLRAIEEHLLVRVNKLIDEDGECRGLKRVLLDMGIALNVGENAVKNLMRLVTTKRQAP